MINNDNDNDIDSPISEQKESKHFPQPIDPKNMNTNEIRRSEESNAKDSQMREIVIINYDQIHKPEVSYSSMHNGLSSPEPNEQNKIESSTTDLKENLSSSTLFALEKSITKNDSFLKFEDNTEEERHQQQYQSKKDNIMKLYDIILHSNISQILQPFFLITEKEEIKDIIGFHKVYELSLYSKFGSKREIKCYRRYDNFNKFHQKIKTKYPYIMIPRLTPKNPLVKFLQFEEEFYENRRLQLIFYINFIATHSILSKTKEFNKFISDANFDDVYFFIDESPMNCLSFSSSPSEMIKNTIITVWNYLGTSGASRKLNDCEILINKMSIHYKNIIDKYSEVKTAICDYIKSIKEDSNDYKSLSETLYYIKDAFEANAEGSKDKLGNYSQFSSKIFAANNNNYSTANQLENKLEALISFLLGICDSFDKYSEFIRRYENVTLMLKNAKENNWDNINLIISEYDMCEILKNKFDVHLSKESNEYIDLFDDMTTEILDEFRALLLNINSEILE